MTLASAGLPPSPSLLFPRHFCWVTSDPGYYLTHPYAHRPMAPQGERDWGRRRGLLQPEEVNFKAVWPSSCLDFWPRFWLTAGVPEQKLVHIGLYPDDLDRLDAWAKERGIPRNQAVVALLNIVTGVSETREQKLARAKGLLARGPIPDDYNHPDPTVAEPDGRFDERVIDKDPEFQQ